MSSEDFKSLIVTDPDLVDEGIDVSGLRTTTDTSPFLLGNIPDYSGIQYSTLAPTKYTDLMRLYSQGLPMFDTPQAAAPVTTAPDTGDGGQATLPIDTIQPIDTPITTDLTDDQINEFATEDTTMPPMLSPDMGASMVTDTTPVDTYTSSTSNVAPDGTTMADMTDDVDLDFFESQMQSNQQQTPPGGGDPEMFYDAPETYSPISPGLDDPLENVTDEELYGITQTSGSIPPGEEGGPGYIEPPTPDNVIAKANIPDYLDNVTLTSAQAPQSQMPQGSPGQLNPYEPENFLADKDINKLDTSEVDIPDNYFTDDSSTDIEDIPVELPATNIETAIEPQAVNTILGPDGITYDAVTENPIYEDLDAQAAATDSQVADLPLEQTNQILQIINNAGDNIQGALTEIGKIPGAIVDKVGETVTLLGQKIDIGKTIASALINKAAGAPISLLLSLLPDDGIQTSTKAARETGLLTGDTTVTQDKYGINTQTSFDPAKSAENYLDYNVKQVEKLETALAKSRAKYDTEQEYLDMTTRMRQELADRQKYVDYQTGVGSTYDTADPNIAGSTSVIDTGSVDEAGLDIADQTDIPESTYDEEIFQEPEPTPVDRPTMADIAGPGDNTFDADTFDDDISTGGLDPNRGQQVDRGTSGAGDNQPVTTTTKPGELSISTYDAELEDDRDVGGGGNDGGNNNGGKIVCTMMNESYGFGSFRNKIWMKFHKDLSPEYQKGYHKLFLPLVRIAKTNKVVKKVLEHIAVHSTIDMRQATRGKTHLLGRVYRKILLPLCYWVGKNAK
jgi:hypothetical protein